MSFGQRYMFMNGDCSSLLFPSKEFREFCYYCFSLLVSCGMPITQFHSVQYLNRDMNCVRFVLVKRIEIVMLSLFSFSFPVLFLVPLYLKYYCAWDKGERLVSDSKSVVPNLIGSNEIYHELVSILLYKYALKDCPQ